MRRIIICNNYSHSTMYLLKQKQRTHREQPDPYSHSTMYLLKLICEINLTVVVKIHIPPCIY